MFHFGFSYIGLLYLLMLYIPNIIWTKYKPEGYDAYAKNENRILLIFERVGEDALNQAKNAGDDISELEKAYDSYFADKNIVNLLALRQLVSPYHPADIWYDCREDFGKTAVGTSMPTYSNNGFESKIRRILMLKHFVMKSPMNITFLLNDFIISVCVV